MAKSSGNRTARGRSDLATPKGEGPLKCCESSLELVNVLKNEIRDGLLTFRSKWVLELGCRYGLPGIFSCLKGASTVHFQDPSAGIIRCRTIPNVLANLEQTRDNQSHQQGSPLAPSWQQLSQDIHFYAGEWDELHTVLSVIQEDEGRLFLGMRCPIKACLRPPYGVMYLTAKKNYIGSSSAVRQLRALVDEEGAFGVHLVAEPPEREIWKFFSK
ncbi:hypothetical protein TRIUR3_02638 [Triticum urartu]|uniref:Histidine protein methyltransferase 1-like protein n=1 Tax=Triticum urartu TaxID=4572 RepID=M8A4W6_TRIUA|nr:hypothetical protein TRIUR3_02638 [Triticum urartu]